MISFMYDEPGNPIAGSEQPRRSAGGAPEPACDEASLTHMPVDIASGDDSRPPLPAACPSRTSPDGRRPGFCLTFRAGHEAPVDSRILEDLLVDLLAPLLLRRFREAATARSSGAVQREGTDVIGPGAFHIPAWPTCGAGEGCGCA